MLNNNEGMVGNKFVIMAIILSLPINLVVNYYYSDSLYELGARMILQMQKYSNSYVDYFFIFFTLIVDPVFVAACCILYMLMNK